MLCSISFTVFGGGWVEEGNWPLLDLELESVLSISVTCFSQHSSPLRIQSLHHGDRFSWALCDILNKELMLRFFVFLTWEVLKCVGGSFLLNQHSISLLFNLWTLDTITSVQWALLWVHGRSARVSLCCQRIPQGEVLLLGYCLLFKAESLTGLRLIKWAGLAG